MRPRYNEDRVNKRLLPWLLLLALAGIMYYLYAPYNDIPSVQNGNDTANPSQALTDDENPSIVDLEDISIATESNLSQVNSEEETIIEHTINEADETETVEKSTPTIEITHGEFEKHLLSINATNNGWQTLQNRDLNPVLLKQLKGLEKRLNHRFQHIDILYSDYVQAGKIIPINSKILAVSTDKWTFFSKEKNGNTLFYDKDGNAPEFSMDRVPFRYTRISSPFNLYRRHPITHRIRPHTGVDLKGAYNTPLAATGNGIVTFAGWQSGYGRIVIIEHNNGYETRYAHLSNIETHIGQQIKRGEIIGTLGNSGASTGAHLHYEVRINGTPYDPMTVKLPSYSPLPNRELKTWQKYAEIYLQSIENIKANNAN